MMDQSALRQVFPFAPPLLAEKIHGDQKIQLKYRVLNEKACESEHDLCIRFLYASFSASKPEKTNKRLNLAKPRTMVLFCLQ
ncbi:MAG TPA: hypothetical protein DCR17_12580 [Verrucomicrobiales bacterium]|nr:hypothetical protein [Pedosphaera sp.]HAO67505.1 hypothetical protein [Verrucomicrobiales bacterium]HAQ97888.1 hypothetical protein [Verrucomicrobiales bacterium]HBP56439.1 hypothetical protein [Verrucomicrobiales bacterium]HCP38177.1 hypothetical protein [Verrucomicrobiales bacterium]